MHVAAINQLTNKVAGTRLVNFQASAAKLLIADLVRHRQNYQASWAEHQRSIKV